MIKRLTTAALLCTLLSCGPKREGDPGNRAGNRVATSGKADVPVGQVPAVVTEAVKAAEPGMKIASAEAETRDGRRYFDIGGTLANGSEIELDVMEAKGGWKVVETQRDIAFSAAPEPVRAAILSSDPAFRPNRVIESRQEGGLIIYELYAPAGDEPQGRKVEIKWDGRQASLLDEEWAH